MCSYRFCTNGQIEKRSLKYFEAEVQTKKGIKAYVITAEALRDTKTKLI